MKKKLTIVVIIIVALLLLIPKQYGLLDGGTIKYCTILYTVTNYHRIKADGYIVGTEIKVLGITVYDNTTFKTRIELMTSSDNYVK